MNLSKIKAEKKEIEEFLGRPDAYTDPSFPTKAKRASTLQEIIDLDQEIARLENNLREARALSSDPELGEIAKSDVETITKDLESKSSA